MILLLQILTTNATNLKKPFTSPGTGTFADAEWEIIFLRVYLAYMSLQTFEPIHAKDKPHLQ